MTKTLGIGYTIFEFDGKTKKPVAMEKAHPGNFADELRKIEARIRKMNDRKLYNMCLWVGLYGFMFRVALSLIQ